MSDILTIDTVENLITKESIDPLPLYDENHPMLKMVMPEYDVSTLPNNNISTLLKRMRMTMKLYGGIGLSANQCGVMERVFIIGTDDFMLTCINPKVLNLSDEIVKENEGCLSFPGMYLRVDRPKSIDVEFTDETGTLRRMTLDGITARCYLHELDHMNGVKFTQYVGTVSLQMAKRKQEKIVKMVKRQFKVKNDLHI